MTHPSPTHKRCSQCGYEWTPRTRNKPAGYEPRSCPACKSYVWSRTVHGKVVEEDNECSPVQNADTSGKP